MKNQEKSVDKVILQNAYLAHVENIIIAMLHDHRLFIRQLALDRIKEATLNDSSSVRKFEAPSKLNWLADDYSDMIFWNNTIITEPPLTKNLSVDKLSALV